MSVSAALRALLDRVRSDPTCATLFEGRVYDMTPGDMSPEGHDPELANGQLRLFLGPMNVIFGAWCGGHKAEMRLYVEGYTASRAPVWDAALEVARVLDGASGSSFGTAALLRPIADVLDPGDGLISVALDLGFAIPAAE